MPELDPRNDDPAAAEHVDQEDEEDLAAAYEALEEDRRQQAALAEVPPLEDQPGQHETEPGDASAEGGDVPCFRRVSPGDLAVELATAQQVDDDRQTGLEPSRLARIGAGVSPPQPHIVGPAAATELFSP